MHSNNAGCAGRNQLFHAPRIQIVGFGIEVAKDGGDLLPVQRVRRGDEGKRWNDYLARQAQRADGNLQGNGSVTHRNSVLYAGEICQPAFKLLDVRTGVCQPAAVENVVESLSQASTIADVRATYVELFGKSGPTTEGGQFFQSV